MMEQRHQRLEQAVLAPLVGAPRSYWAFVAVLLAIIAWALYAYSTQIQSGLVQTSMRDRVSPRSTRSPMPIESRWLPWAPPPRPSGWRSPARR